MTQNRRSARSGLTDRQSIVAVGAFRSDFGRWPSPVSNDEQEAVLGVWLHRQRTLHHQGVIDEFRRSVLDENLPGWVITANEVWIDSARLLSNFVFTHGRLPKSWAPEHSEHLTGLWLDLQLNLNRSGILRPQRTAWLEEHCPGWNAPCVVLEGAS